MDQDKIDSIASALNRKHGINEKYIAKWIKSHCKDKGTMIALLALNSSQFADKLFGKLTVN